MRAQSSGHDVRIDVGRSGVRMVGAYDIPERMNKNSYYKEGLCYRVITDILIYINVLREAAWSSD